MNNREEGQTVDDISIDNGELPVGWEWTSVGEHATVKGGKRLPKGHSYAEIKTNHPYVRVTDFRDMTISTKDLKYIDENTYEAIERYTISKSDLYISIAGSIGKVGFVPEELDGANLTENAAKLTELRGVDLAFLCHLLNSTLCQDQIEQFITSSGQPKLALFRIEKIAVPLAPLAEQKRIVTCVESLLSEVEAARISTKSVARILGFDLVLKGSSPLVESILVRAFCGELVETEAELAKRENRSYESASELLARIKKERPTEVVPSKGRRKKRRRQKGDH